VRTSRTSRVAGALLGVALLASACGGDGEPDTAAGLAAAEAIDDLATSDDVTMIEVLDVATGAPATLDEAVTGDRPVLLWFWAPH